MDSEDETTPILPENTKKKQRCNGYCRPDSNSYRYTLMLVICIVPLGDFFGGNTPYALEDHIMTVLGLTESKFMIFASCMQWAQIGMALLGGYLVDRMFGIRFSVVLSAVVMAAAQGLFAGGAMMNSFWTMVGARTVFGAFIGLVWVSTNKMSTKWFKDKELTFVTGLKLCFARLGTVLTLNMMDQLYSAFNVYFSNLHSLAFAMFVAAGFCSLSAIFSFVYYYMDKKAEAQNIPPVPDVRDSSGNVVIPRKLRIFPLQFWLLTIMVTFGNVIFPTFTPLGQVFFEVKYGVSLDSASILNSLNFMIGAIFMPPMGIVIDKVGRNLNWILAGTVLQTGGLLLMIMAFTNPYIPITMAGISYGLTQLATWPLFSYVVHIDYLGMAFGIIRTAFCIMLSVSTYVAGYLAEYCGYVYMELFLLLYSCVALVFCAIIFVIDMTHDGNLNLGPTARLLHEKRARDGI